MSKQLLKPGYNFTRCSIRSMTMRWEGHTAHILVTNAYTVDKTLKEKDHKLILQDMCVCVCACMHAQAHICTCMYG